MPILHIFVLAAIQGITEFWPISSSGHLILVPFFTGWPDQGLAMDVAVHVGTLGAVMLYFYRDVQNMLSGLYRLARGRDGGAGTQLVGWVILATLPVLIAGYFVNKYAGDSLRSITIIGWTTLGFGMVLYVVDRFGLTVRTLAHFKFFDALVIGLAQILALIPGTSRSGITITAARALGVDRREAARFSMLLSMPTILGAGVLKGYEVYQSGDAVLWSSVGLAAGLAFIAALLSLFVMMAWIRRATFTPFVIYRMALGGVLLWFAYGFNLG